MLHTRALAVGLVTLTLNACVFVPVRSALPLGPCPDRHPPMELRLEYVQGFEQCSGEGCLAVVALMGITALSSAIISGSIVLVSNALERNHDGQRCVPVPSRSL